MKWRCLAAIPLPAKKTVEEHAQTQANFLEQTLEPALEQARAGDGHVLFVDAAHFVMGSFLCCVWCFVKLMIRAGSGRKRYSVLGAWNAVTNTLVRITTDTTINADTMCDLLRKISELGLVGPIRLVLDNARYQHCAQVIELARELGITLEFLPTYSPNLNLIERLWRFVKKDTTKTTCCHICCRGSYNRSYRRLSVGTARTGELVPWSDAFFRRIRTMSRSQHSTVPPRAEFPR